MQIKHYSNLEMEIQKLKDIRMIQYEDLYVKGYTGKAKILPGFFVLYGNHEMLFLNTNDKGFPQFVKKLREVYLEEKDHIIQESILGPQKIQIDDLTKEILLSKDLEGIDSLYKDYYEEDGYSDSLFFQEDEFSNIFPIVEYHLRNMLKNISVELGDLALPRGMNGNYHILAMIHNVPTYLPVSFMKLDDSYQIVIGNVLPHSIGISLTVNFHKDKIEVLGSIPEYEYFDTYTYQLENGLPSSIVQTEWKGKMVRYQKSHLEKSDVPNNRVSREENLEWVHLPWGAYYGYYQTEEEFLKDNFFREQHVVYLSRNDFSYYEREHYMKQFFQKYPSGTMYYPIVLDSFQVVKNGVKEDGYSILEVSFSERGKEGSYQDRISGKKFYILGSGESWDDFSKKKIFFNRRSGLESQVDLTDQKIIQKRMSEYEHI